MLAFVFFGLCASRSSLGLAASRLAFRVWRLLLPARFFRVASAKLEDISTYRRPLTARARPAWLKTLVRLPVVAWGKGDAPSPGRPGEAAPLDTTKAPPGERKRRTGRHGARVPRRARARAHPARTRSRAPGAHAHVRTGSARSRRALAPFGAPRRVLEHATS